MAEENKEFTTEDADDYGLIQEPKEFIIESKKAAELLCRHLGDVCLGNNIGKRILTRLVSFCRKVANSNASLFDMSYDGFMGTGKGVRSIKSGCIMARFAQQEGYSSSRIDSLIISALLHDIGLLKDDSSGDGHEQEEHVMTGYKMLGSCADNRIDEDVRDAALQHHERYDGTGYPFGISGQLINNASVIVGLIDEFISVNSTSTDAKDVRRILDERKAGFEEKIYKDFREQAFWLMDELEVIEDGV